MSSSREQVVAMVRVRPEMNMSDIARELGISRERVRQIVATERLSVPRGVRGIASKSSPRSRIATGGITGKLTASAAGTISELLAAADLTARGLVVFFPLVRNAACDLITLRADTGKTERIEVRCGHRTASGGIAYNVPDKSKSDRRALVIVGEPVAYSPPF